MMQYQSTRGSENIKTGAAAIIQGIAEDRGLYVPMSVPKLPFAIEDMVGKSYQEVAFAIVKTFFDDLK